MSIPDAPWIEHADTNGVPPRNHYRYQSGCEDCERGEVYYDENYEDEDEEEDYEMEEIR